MSQTGRHQKEPVAERSLFGLYVDWQLGHKPLRLKQCHACHVSPVKVVGTSCQNVALTVSEGPVHDKEHIGVGAGPPFVACVGHHLCGIARIVAAQDQPSLLNKHLDVAGNATKQA